MMFPPFNYSKKSVPSKREIPKPKQEKSLSSNDTKSLIDDLFLSNLLDKKNGYAELVGIDQLRIWKKYFDQIVSIDYNYISSHNTRDYDDKKESIKDIGMILQERYDIVYKLLELASGHLSLCGGAIIDLLDDKTPNDFDLFFHGLSLEEIDILLEKCLKLIADNSELPCYYRSAGAITVHDKLDDDDIKIQFIRRVYQTKDQVLLGFDLMACRSGYNPYDGFFATIDGAVAISMKAFPLDLTQRSTSHGHRLEKYVGKGFKIFLPGLPTDFKQEVETPDGKLYYDDPYFTIYPERYDTTDYGDVEEDHTYMNWWYAKEEKYQKIIIETDNYPDILTLTDETIKKSISFSYHDVVFPKKTDTLREILKEEYKAFATAWYVENDHETASKLWNEKLDYYVEKVKANIDFFSWRHENPGGQNFGKFNPIIADPREWYGEHYQPVECGLSNERLLIFRQLQKQGVPNEILNLVCDFWLAAEVKSARERLFALH